MTNNAHAPHEQAALTVDQAAASLTLGRTKTLELIRSGALRSVRIGKRIVVPRIALEAFLQSQLEEGL